MSAVATLQDALAAAAGSAAAVHYVNADSTETRVSYAALRERALGMLGFLQRRGLQSGDELVLMTDELAPFVDVFWACMLGRIIVVPLAAGANDEHREKALRVLRKLRKPRLLLERKALARLHAHALEGEFADLDHVIHAGAIPLDDVTDLGQAGSVVPVTADDIAFVQFSSGSTGAPKGVTLTHGNLVTNAQAIIAGIGGADSRDTSFSWMPLTHDMGLIGFHITPVVACASHWLMTPALFVRRPLLWMQKVAEHRVTVTCSPNFGYKHLLKSLDPAAAAALDLRAVRVVVNGAEPISAALCHDFLAAFTPAGLGPDVMLPVYGLAEASLAVTFAPVGRTLATVALARDALGPGNTVRVGATGASGVVDYVKVGTPVLGCSLRIAAADGAEVAPGIVGRILIRGASVTRGYYRDDALTAAVLAQDGWLDTGDLGALVDGELVITGRAKDVVFVAGRTHYPQDLEALLARHGDIELGRAAVVGIRAADGVSDDLALFVVHKGQDPVSFAPVQQRAARVLAEHAGIALCVSVPVRTLPKTTSGKLQRFVLAQDYADGAYAGICAQLLAQPAAEDADRDGSALESALLAICRTAVPGRALAADDNLFESGTSSLTLAQIYERVDAAYPGMLEVTDFFDYPTVHAMAGYLAERLAAADAVAAR